MLYLTEEELLYKAQSAEGKTFGEIDKSGRILNEKSKGHLGQIIEESFFGYEVNSNAEADFSNLDIELKVTPIKQNKNGTISAKERLVLNIINYEEEVKYIFETSSFWKKNKQLLLMIYLWQPNLKRADYRIIKSFLHTFSEEDLEVIKQDWGLIVNKIIAGLAHELSEADTVYLGASTKGANKNSLRTQPFNTIKAMQRAFSLKQSYMTALVRKTIKGEQLVSITNPSELKNKSFEQLLYDRFKPYLGKTLNEIAYQEGIEVNTKSKSFLQEFISGLLGIKGTKLKNIEEFAKANIEFKTIRLEPNGVPKEHMSFKNVDFTEWVEISWEDSWIKTNFEETKYLFIVFEYRETERINPERKLYFRGIKLWNMPLHDIENTLAPFWEDVKKLLLEGVKLEKQPWGSSYRVLNNLPSPGYNGICHIRPKGRDGKDKVKLPDGQWISKQAFWLDREYISKIVKDL